MSRSIVKTKIHGNTTAISEKKDKSFANRKLRRLVNQLISPDRTILPKLREVSNVWCFGKDGKRYNSLMTTKDLRK